MYQRLASGGNRPLQSSETLNEAFATFQETTALDGLWIWAQVQAPTPGIDPAKMPLLALRRWCSSLTLSSPEVYPSLFGLWAGLTALGVLLILVVLAQGPIGALRQVLDVPGFWSVLRGATGRLKRSPRLVAILLGTAVLSWTGWEFRGFSNADRIEDLAILLKNKGLGEVAFEQAYLAALTPLRDVAALGDLWPLLVAATLVVFKLSADRWGMIPSDAEVLGVDTPPAWTSSAWAAGALYALYRAIQDFRAPDGLPMGGCMFLEAAFIPLLMLTTDGLLLGWVIAEIARARPDQPDSTEGYAVLDGLHRMPLAMIACLIAMPARYAATAVWLALSHLNMLLLPEDLAFVAGFVRGRGLIVLQAASLVILGLVGALAWGRPALRRFGRMLRLEGGHLLAWLVVLCSLVGGISGLATWLVLSLPTQAWVLAAADSYAHLASFPLGLLMLSGLIELAHRVEPALLVKEAGEQDESEVEPGRAIQAEAASERL